MPSIFVTLLYSWLPKWLDLNATRSSCLKGVLSEYCATVRGALFLTNIPWVECVHCVIFFVALHVIYSGNLLVFIYLVNESYLKLLFLLTLLRRCNFLLRSIHFYNGRAKAIVPLTYRLITIYLQATHLFLYVGTLRT